MSNLKDTDIDDLFRRASEKYPLRTDSSDWDRMAAALEKDPPPDFDGENGEEERKRRRFLWLFLLLPLAGVGYYTWNHHGAGKTLDVKTNVSSVKNAPAASTTEAAKINGGRDNSQERPTNSDRDIAGKSDGTGNRQSGGNHDGIGKQKGTGKYEGTGNEKGVGNDDGAGNQQGKGNRQATGNQQGGADHFSASGGVVDAGDPARGNRQTPTGRGPLSLVAENDQDRLFYDLRREPIDRNYQLKVNVTAPAAKKDSSAAKQKASTKPKTAYFYAGILGAPDLSTVRMQSVKGVGTTFGILLGYAFNPHWAVESGVYVDRKKYYTDGEYFSTKEVKLPYPNVDLLNVNGTCYMWEIPLNVRYNLNPNGKTKWFATAGLSTYLMTKENYSYAWKWYGSSNVSDSAWKIKKPSQYPFSIINLSAGFEQRLGKAGNLRIEPYVRIPLGGVGTGKLPIMSAGINIGFTRQLW